MPSDITTPETVAGTFVLPAGQTSVHARAVVVLVCVGMFMTTLDSSIVNIGLPSIARAFGAPLSGAAEWVILGYLVIIAALLLTFGRLFRHRRAEADLDGRSGDIHGWVGAVWCGALAAGTHCGACAPGGRSGVRAVDEHRDPHERCAAERAGESTGVECGGGGVGRERGPDRGRRADGALSAGAGSST